MSLLSLFLTSFHRGGPVMWPILAVSVVVWVIGFDKLFLLRRLRGARRKFLAAAETGGSAAAVGDEAYERLCSDMGQVKSGALSFEYAFRHFLLACAPGLENGFSTMSAWISAAPLLGLLGTVAGMIQTFRIITEFGIGNPHLMAEGISIALLTTQAGLTVAFPAMLFHNYLLNKKNILMGQILGDGERLSKRFG